MNEHQLVPHIRFWGFEEEWEQRKLREVAEITMGQSPRSSNYTDNPSDYILVQGNADMKDGKVFPRVWTTEITKTANHGDIILSVRAPVGEVGKTDYDVVLGRGVSGVKGNEFIFQSLKKMNFVGYWNRFSTGSTFESINSNDIKDAKITIPSEQEQKQIGSFFNQLDTLITLQQQKIDQLGLLKKALLQNLFPAQGAKIPTLRFQGFEDEWEAVKFGNFARKNSCKNKNLLNTNVESISNKTGFTKQSEQFDGYRVASLDLSNYYVIKEEQFAYNPSRINVGSIAYKKIGDEESIVSPLYISFSTKNNINNQFLWFWFKTQLFTQQRVRLSEGGVRDTLPFENLKQIQVWIPKISEQQKIGTFLAKLDHLIELEQQKLDKIKQVKKALLQNMFVK